MAEVEQKVTQTKKQTVGADGELVRERTSKVETNADKKATAINIVWYVYGVISILLAIRFVLRLFGANAANGFVDFIYSVSGVLSAPFDSIFNAKSIEAGQTQSVFEPSILVAIVVYGLLAWGIGKLLTLNDN